MKSTTLIAVMALGLSACGSAPGGGAASSAGLVRWEQYCSKGGLEPSLRQTFILIDRKVLKQAQQATNFNQANGFIRDIVLSFADPKRALPSGLSAPRERISVLLVPSDGSPAEALFSGCIPGLSSDEELVARQGSSSLGEFFTGDPLDQLSDDSEKFQLALIGALIGAAKKGVPEIEAQEGPLASTALFAAIKSSRGALETPNGMVGRYVIVSDLSGASFGNEESKDTPYQQGLDAGASAGGDFGLSEVAIVQPAGTLIKGKNFVEGFLLAQGGKLTSYSVDKPAVGDRAPLHVLSFDGEAAYPSRKQNIKLRIARDNKGSLTSSWLIVTGGTNQSIPLSGQISCSRPKACTIISDDKGFAQAWASRKNAAPEFSNDIPFGGMRNFSFTIEGKSLKGEVSDPMVQLGDDPSKDSIAIRAQSR